MDLTPHPQPGRPRTPTSTREAITVLLALGLLLAALLTEGQLVDDVRCALEPTVEAGLRGRPWPEQLVIGVVAGVALAAPDRHRRVTAERWRTVTAALTGWWTVSVVLLLWVLAAPPRHGSGSAQEIYRHAVGSFWWSSPIAFALSAAVLSRRSRPIAAPGRTPV